MTAAVIASTLLTATFLCSPSFLSIAALICGAVLLCGCRLSACRCVSWQLRTHRKGIYRGECFAAGSGCEQCGRYHGGCHKAVEAISSHI